MPRIDSPNTARPEYYDRNPSQQISGAENRVTENTSSTTRYTITAASNRKVFVSMMDIELNAETVATTTTAGDRVRGSHTITPDGGSETQVMTVRMTSEDYAAGDTNGKSVGPFAMLLPGDALKGTDEFQGDAGGNGVVRISLAVWAVAYDE